MSDTVKSWIEGRRGIHEQATEGSWSYIKDTRSDGFPVFRVGSNETGEDILSVPRYRHEWDGVHIADSVVDAHNMFPRALDALEQVLEMHKPVHQVFSWQEGGTTPYDPCETCHGKAGKPGDYECGCWSDGDLVYTCAECRDDKGRDVDWPCATVQTIEGAINNE